jgi:hypothetical protein
MPEIRYLNTDLDLVAERDLTPLSAALEARGLFALNITQAEDQRWYAIFEVDGPAEPESPEQSMSLMLDAIESLSGPARDLWLECSRREFNIGYDCGDHPWAFNNGLSNRTLLRIGSAGASVRITLYPPDKSGRPAVVGEDQPSERD